MAINLNWIKLTSGNWPNLETVNLANVSSFGVYVIWNSNGQIVRVGQGDIASRLSSHRNDVQVLQYRVNGLYVTWASVSAQSVDGVERYLYDRYSPLVGERAPDTTPVAVNLPGQ